MEMPAIEKLTEKESAHPSQHQLDKLTKSGPSGTLFSTGSTAGYCLPLLLFENFFKGKKKNFQA